MFLYLQCLWCLSTNNCTDYPVPWLLPPASLCPLSQARWGMCWSELASLCVLHLLLCFSFLLQCKKHLSLIEGNCWLKCWRCNLVKCFHTIHKIPSSEIAHHFPEYLFAWLAQVQDSRLPPFVYSMRMLKEANSHPLPIVISCQETLCTFSLSAEHMLNVGSI